MRASNVAGAIVSVVKDGEIIFNEGFGYSDLEGNKKVNPDETMFILGSLSKLFTWTAVMQLVEKGKLDLNTDVNEYLDFEIPATFSIPITLKNLMAHNHGFQDVKFGQMTANANDVIPIGEWLKNNIPERVYPPGKYSAYANYGTALAGYIVERVSGKDYHSYIEKNILIPLEMNHTTSRQPIPEKLLSDLAKGYMFINDEYQSQELFTNIAAQVAPAASFRSSGVDMSKFMMAHLNYKKNGIAKIFEDKTAEIMHSQSFTHDPRVNGMAHGFWELDMNGQTIIGHSGSHFTFNSFLMLLPDQNLGIYISTNSRGGTSFLGENFDVFKRDFIEHFFPKNILNPKSTTDFTERFDKYKGNFHFTHGRSETTPENLFGMLMATNIETDHNGLTLSLTGAPKRYIEIEPNVFQEEGSENKLVFHSDDNGNITEAFYNPLPLTALVKNKWYSAIGFNLVLLSFCLLLFLSVIIRGIVSIILHFIGKKESTRQQLAKNIRRTEFIVSFLSICCLLNAFASNIDIYNVYIGNLPLWLYTQPITVFIALLMFVMIFLTAQVWKKNIWSLSGRIYNTLITMATVGFVWFMYFWNILGKSF